MDLFKEKYIICTMFKMVLSVMVCFLGSYKDSISESYQSGCQPLHANERAVTKILGTIVRNPINAYPGLKAKPRISFLLF